jgi:HAD superfamily hydrolase (TIGR01509 family)
MKAPVLLLDIGDVFIKADQKRTFAALEAEGVPSSRASQFFKNDAYREFSRGKILESEFCRYLSEHLGISRSCEELKKAHHAHLYEVDAEMLTLLASLKNYRSAFATATNEWQTERERELIILDRPNRPVFRSHILGKLKTDEGFFESVAEHLSVPVSDMLLVDDSRENVAYAEKTGMQAILFLNASQLKTELNVYGIHCSS